MAAAVLFLVLWVIEAVATEAFPGLISIVLIVAPYIQYRAYRKLRRQHLQDPTIQSLRSAMYTALALVIVSSSLAVVGGVVVLRAFNLVGPIDRQTFLLLLAFPLLLLVAPAVEWLRLKVRPIAEVEA